jgi:hypothetical protein
MTDTTGRKLAVRCAVLFVLLFGLVTTANGAERVMIKIGDPPLFSLQDIEGRMVTAPGDFK